MQDISAKQNEHEDDEETYKEQLARAFMPLGAQAAHLDNVLRAAQLSISEAAAAAAFQMRRFRSKPTSRDREFALPELTHSSPVLADSKDDRFSLLNAYKRECRENGIKVTDQKIAKAADPRWNDRTWVSRWKQCNPRCTPAVDSKIRSVLTKKPHLKP